MINKILYIALVGALLIAFAYILHISDVITWDVFNASAAAILLNMFNSSVAFLLFDLSRGKGNNIFLIYNIGGMGARILFLAVAILILLKTLIISEYAFILVFFIFYFIMLVLEIIYFRSKVETKQR